MPNPNLPINSKNNSYIGARYVPIFANKDLNYQWTNTRSYEPLMIVLYQGNSYTSTTFVPIGVDIFNTTYWANTGNYNAQMAQLQELFKEGIINQNNKIQELNYVLCFPKTTQDTSPEGFCGGIIKKDGGLILFDLGEPNNTQQLIQTFKDNGAINIDAIIMSHYHTDHSGNPSLWAESFTTNSTKLFLPLASSKYPETQDNLSNILSAFQSAQKIYPTEGESFNVDEHIEAKFYNCGAVANAYYDANSDSYNDYSMVTFVKIGGSILCFTGDIEITAQNRMYSLNQYMQATFMTAPHHGVSNNGNINLGLAISPQYMYSADSILDRIYINRDPFIVSALSRGGKITLNSLANKDIFYNITNWGIQPPCANLSNAFGCRISNQITIYVDSTSTIGYADGSQEAPFLSLEDALGICDASHSWIINVLNVNENGINIYGKSNIQFNISASVNLSGLSFQFCSNIYIFGQNTNLKINTVNAINSSNVTIRAVKINDSQIIRSANINFQNVIVEGSRDGGVIQVDYSSVCFEQINFTGNPTYGISVNNSTINGKFDLGALTIPKLYHITGGSNISPIVGTTTELNKICDSVSTGVVAFDVTRNVLVFIRNGNIYPAP